MRITVKRRDHERRHPSAPADRRAKLPLGVRVRYALSITVALIAAYGAGKAYQTSQDLSGALAHQTRNRTGNVAVWCSAINQGRDYDRGFVAHVTGGRVSYRLPDLPCRVLERNTLASTKPR